jgi:two-component system chemotaxis response regulator CheB
MHGHDIIALGGSAGGVEALRQIAAGLPAGLPASLFVAINQLPYGRSYLPDVLSKAGPIHARHPADREPIRPGTMYVAPPDHHLLVGDGIIRVVQGPKENNARPAIDPLFRTAAVAYGPRVVGVVLSGYLDDGSAGLAAVQARGGVAVVQDPADAVYPEMPENALRQVGTARCLATAQIGPELARLAREPAPPARGDKAMTDALKWEAAMAAWDPDALHGAERPGKPSPFSCPRCGGDLWEVEAAGSAPFRCRTGHAYSPLSLLADQAAAVEDGLNEAFRALKEKEHLEQRMARQSARHGNGSGADYHTQQAKKAEQAAAAIWRLLLEFGAGTDGPAGPPPAG